LACGKKISHREQTGTKKVEARKNNKESTEKYTTKKNWVASFHRTNLHPKAALGSGKTAKKEGSKSGTG